MAAELAVRIAGTSLFLIHDICLFAYWRVDSFIRSTASLKAFSFSGDSGEQRYWWNSLYPSVRGLVNQRLIDDCALHLPMDWYMPSV